MNHPYASLTPDVVMDAVESTGYKCDARILELNSYENRVYQVGIEDQEPIIVKFYRHDRWSDEQIIEEHVFTQELLDNEITSVFIDRAQNKVSTAKPSKEYGMSTQIIIS